MRYFEPGFPTSLFASTASTWAARGTGAAVGQLKLISDIGSTGGTLFKWNGTYWRPAFPLALINVTPVTGAASTTELVHQQLAVPAGLLVPSCRFSIIRSAYKTGTANTATRAYRLGTAGTTADAAIGNTNVGFNTASNQSYGDRTHYYAVSATSIQALGRGDGLSELGGANQAIAGASAVSDITANALILSACWDLSASSADTVTNTLLQLEIYS